MRACVSEGVVPVAVIAVAVIGVVLPIELFRDDLASKQASE